MSPIVKLQTKRLLAPEEQSDSKPAGKKFKTDDDLSDMTQSFVKPSRLAEPLTLQSTVSLPLNSNETYDYAETPMSLPDDNPRMPVPQATSSACQPLSSVPSYMFNELPLKKNIHQAILRAAETGNLYWCQSSKFISDMPSCRMGLVNKRGETPLITACVNGHYDVVRFLVEVVGVDLNEFGVIYSIGHQEIRPIIGTALHAAVAVGNVSAVDYLLKAGLQVNQPIVNEKTRDGLTALHLAAIYLTGDIQFNVVFRLLYCGADFTITDHAGRQCWQLMPGVDFTMLLVQFWKKFGVTQAMTQQTRSNFEMFYRSASSTLNLKNFIQDVCRSERRTTSTLSL